MIITAAPALQIENEREDLESGLAGELLLLLERYAAFGDPVTLEEAGNIVSRLLNYCESTLTRDYSLYKGRGGVVFSLLQYFVLTGDGEIVRRCVVLMQPAAGDYLQSRWTTDDLYDGRAGTLLVLWFLFQLTESPDDLLTPMRLFLEKLIDNMRLSVEGVYWPREKELNERPSCAMGFGIAGILYVLKTMMSGQDIPALRWIITIGNEFLSKGWIGELQNWGYRAESIASADDLKKYKEAYREGREDLFRQRDEIGWAFGAAGILLASYSDLPGDLQSSTLARLTGLDESAGNSSIFDGIAGVGLVLLELGKHTGIEKLAVTAQRMADLFAASGEAKTIGSTGLLHGNAGIGYFLTRMANPASPLSSLVAPSLPEGWVRRKSPRFDISLQKLREKLLTDHYPRTVGLLEAVEPAGWQALLAAPDLDASRGLLDWFSNGIQKKELLRLAPTVYERIADVFQLEAAKAALIQTSGADPLKAFIAAQVRLDHVFEQLNHSDEWLWDQVLELSPAIRILTSRWDWGCSEDHNAEYNKGIVDYHLGNLNRSPQRFEYLIQVGQSSGNSETFLKTDTLLLLHQFDTPKTVRQAIVIIKQYIGSMPEEMLKQLLNGVADFVEVRRFKKHIDAAILYQLRQWIYCNVLVIQE